MNPELEMESHCLDHKLGHIGGILQHICMPHTLVESQVFRNGSR